MADRITHAQPIGRIWTEIPGIAGERRVRLHARVVRAADAPVVVMIGGFGISGAYWEPLAAALAGRAEICIPDLPGHGDSDRDRRPLGIIEHAESVAAWMDARELRHANVVGHSLGCQIAAELTLARPDLVHRLVLIAPTSDPAARTVPRQAVRAARSASREPASLVRLAARDYAKAGIALLRHELRELISHRLEDVAPRLAFPVHIIRGAGDALVSDEWTRALATLTASAVTTIPGASHNVHYSHPLEVAEAMGSVF